MREDATRTNKMVELKMTEEQEVITKTIEGLADLTSAVSKLALVIEARLNAQQTLIVELFRRVEKLEDGD